MFNVTEHTDHAAELTFRLTDSPTAQERVFDFLLDGAGEASTEAEVRGYVGLPKTTTHVALASLVQQGLVLEERVGRTGLYSVDSEDPLVRTMKRAKAINLVRGAIKPTQDSIDLVVLFGSASRGENRRDSDVDVLVVTSDEDAVLAELARYQWLQPVVMTPDAHMELIATGGTFAKETAGGITVWERR